MGIGRELGLVMKAMEKYNRMNFFCCCLFNTNTIVLNCLIMAAAAMGFAMKAVASFALVNTIIKAIEQFFKYDANYENSKQLLLELKRLENRLQLIALHKCMHTL